MAERPHAAPLAQGADALEVASIVRRQGATAPASSWQPAPLLRLLGSLWRLFATRPVPLLGGLLSSLARAGLLVLVSLAVGRLVAGAGEGGWAPWALSAAAGLLGAAALGCLGQRMVIDRVQDGLTALRHRLVDVHLALPVGADSERGREAFVLAVTRDCELLGQMARACFAALLPAALLVLLCLGGIAVALPALAAPLALGLAGLWWVRRGLSRRLAGEMARAHEGIDRLYEQLGGTVLRHELAVSHGNEARERQACRAAIDQTHACTQALARTQTWAAELDTLSLGLALLALVAWLAVAGATEVSGASLATVLFLLLALRGALQAMLRAQQEMAQGVPALAAIEGLLAMPAAPTANGQVLPTAWHVQLRGVGCRVGARAVLRDVDLDLAPGRFIALTGPNGAGKTTLLRLLLGLAEAEGGSFHVDGVPWAEIDRTAFRRGVGYLPQSAGLFAGTLFDNVAYGLDAAEAASASSAKRARELLSTLGLDVLLTTGPTGLDTRLGPGGSPLSGGERQRVALARVLMRRPRLLILDEPSNHLDAASVQALLGLLRQLPGRPAVLVVSHDPVVIAQADSVLALVDGFLRPRLGANASS